jgi:hypothetical protein
MKRNADAAPEHGPSLTMEQIDAAISEIARHGTGPDRLKALTLLRRTDAPRANSIPEPISSTEIVERLARLLKPAGLDLVRQAVARAFPGLRRPIEEPIPVGVEHLPQETLDLIANKIRTVENLYKYCPELKRSGQPPGYPQKSGPLARQAFVQALAKRYFADRLNMNLGPVAATVGTGNSAPLPSDDDAVPRTAPGPRDVGEPPGR